MYVYDPSLSAVLSLSSCYTTLYINIVSIVVTVQQNSNAAWVLSEAFSTPALNKSIPFHSTLSISEALYEIESHAVGGIV